MNLHPSVKKAGGLSLAKVERHEWASTTKLPGNYT